MKDVQDLYSKNDRILPGEVEDVNKWGKKFMFVNKNTNNVKMSGSPNLSSIHSV